MDDYGPDNVHEWLAEQAERRYAFIGRMISLVVGAALVVIGAIIKDAAVQTAGGTIIAAVVAQMSWKAATKPKTP